MTTKKTKKINRTIKQLQEVVFAELKKLKFRQFSVCGNDLTTEDDYEPTKAQQKYLDTNENFLSLIERIQELTRYKYVSVTFEIEDKVISVTRYLFL